MHHLTLTSSDSTFVSTAVSKIAEVITAAIKDHGNAIVGLSGGSTPRPVYEALAKSELIDWSKVTFFLVDERYCPAMSEESNQKMVKDSWIRQAHHDVTFIFPDTSLPIDQCIAKYAKDLKEFWAQHLPDLMILGMGDDGHIASLFPPLTDIALSDERLVIGTTTDRFAVHDRISISLNAICAAEHPIILLKGTEKKKVWEEMMQSKENERRWPMKRVMEVGNVEVIAQW